MPCKKSWKSRRPKLSIKPYKKTVFAVKSKAGRKIMTLAVFKSKNRAKDFVKSKLKTGLAR